MEKESPALIIQGGAKRQVLTKIGIEPEPWTDLSLIDTDILRSKPGFLFRF
jgi:hypothetical protein